MSQTKRDKPVIFVATDSPAVNTGFGKVCRELVTRWAATNKYTIVCMGVNDRAEWHPIRNHPNIIIEPLPYITEDPYGIRRMPELLSKYKPDLIFSLNDIWVWTGDERHPNMNNWFYNHIKSYKPYTPWVGYFPVDANLWEFKWAALANSMDYACTFTDYGRKILSQTDGFDMSHLKVVYHGHDHENFYPVEDKLKLEQRAKMGIPSDYFVITNVNRSQPRKNIPATMYAFEMFHKGYSVCKNCGFPISLRVFKECELCGGKEFEKKWDGVEKALLYLHMHPTDMRGYRLPKIQRDLKLKNVLYPINFDVAKGVPIEELNLIYNMSDVLVSSSASGGYELTNSEALSCGKPVIATRTTSITEQLQDGRGILVPPITYHIYEDACQSPKHLISIPKLTEALVEVYQNQEKYNSPELIQKRIEFSKSRSWGLAADQFMEMFDELLENRINISSFIKDEIPTMLLSNTSINLANVVSMLPAVKSFVRSNQSYATILLGVKERFYSLIKELVPEINVVNMDKTWIDDENIQGKRFQINQVDNFATEREKAGLVLGEGNAPNYIDGYAQGFNLDVANSTISSIKLASRKNLEKNEPIVSSLRKDKNDYVFTFIFDFVSPEEKISPKAFNSSISLLKRKPNIKTILMPNKDEEMQFPGIDLEIRDNTLQDILAICELSDCIVTNIEEFSHLCSFIQKPFIIVNTSKTLRHVAKYNTVKDENGDSLVYFLNARRGNKSAPFELGQADLFASVVRMFNHLNALKNKESGD